jgi:hypothetical protein
VQPDPLDHRFHLWLWIAQPKLSALNSLPSRQHGQVDHQRGVGKREFSKINRDIATSLDCPRECASPVSLGRSILVSSTTEDRRRVIELDDPWNLQKIAAEGQVASAPVSGVFG